MWGRRIMWCLPLLLALAAATVAGGSAGAEDDPRPLRTAVVDPTTLTGANAKVAVKRIRAAGAAFVRLSLDWRSVLTPSAQARRPRRFQPRDPDDRAYVWKSFDRQVKLAFDHDLEPLVTITGAPTWAYKPFGTKRLKRPDPKDFADFAAAVTERYDGELDGLPDGLPHVRYWHAWNEPNHPGAPELVQGSPDWYRELLNRFARVVHEADADNRVIAGGSSPFTTSTSLGPMTFMRRLLCMAGDPPQPKCNTRVSFDIWSHHPYTPGAPTRRAKSRQDAAIGDLPEMKRILDAAVESGNAASDHDVEFWVTEFSWDTKPPDPKGVPMSLHARWVSEALYRMWDAGVSLVTWWRIRDDPLGKSFYQSGLYFRGTNINRDSGKPTLVAFRFPFVAFREGEKVLVWGRTPKSESEEVVVEYSEGAGWEEVGRLEADEHGVFTDSYELAGEGRLRARIEGTATSLAFSLKVPPDKFFSRFGA